MYRGSSQQEQEAWPAAGAGAPRDYLPPQLLQVGRTVPGAARPILRAFTTTYTDLEDAHRPWCQEPWASGGATNTTTSLLYQLAKAHVLRATSVQKRLLMHSLRTAWDHY